jgi:hypothetical protein
MAASFSFKPYSILRCDYGEVKPWTKDGLGCWGGWDRRRERRFRLLLDVLHDENVQHRKMAVWTLGNIGQRAVEAIPALLLALRDSNEGVRKMARDALEGRTAPGCSACRGRC